MKVVLWGTRGSLPTPGSDSHRYGGNTSCVQVIGDHPQHVIVLDAGSGIRSLGDHLPADVARVDVLLSHLHMDHVMGLGFFRALYSPGLEVHLWGPASTTLNLRERLARLLSPPLFPVRLRELPCRLSLHDVPLGTFDLPDHEVTAALVCHPGPTVGYRVDDGRNVLTYLSDHEPALGVRHFPESPRWTSGHDLAADTDLLIHDAQYDEDEYRARVGWGHSSITHATSFATAVGARHLVAFHHDPAHDDALLDGMYARTDLRRDGCPLTPAREGDSFVVGA